jgi:hypothetical protein
MTAAQPDIGPGLDNSSVMVGRMEKLADLVYNVAMTRAELLTKLIDPRRDINKECGYPNTEQLNVLNHYKPLYEREPVAARVVNLFPSESWKVVPEVYDEEDEEVETEFEQAFKNVCNSLKGISWHGGEEGNPLWEYLKRVDELSGVGHFGVLLLGLDDGLALHEPAAGLDPVTGLPSGNGRQARLLYLRAFDEALADIVASETNPASPRHGLPTYYNLKFHDPNFNSQSNIGVDLTTRKVHWTRVIHVADNLSSSEVFGTPRLRPVFDPCCDIHKVRCGSGEMYWRGAFPGMSVETHPQLGADVGLDQDAIRTKMTSYMNGLQRYMAIAGATIKTLSPQVVDPTPQINVQIDSICIQLGVPVRIFKGSERGELSSSQDKDTWDERIELRQKTYLTPRLIVPVVDRLIALGVLPEPLERYHVKWPDIRNMSAVTRADVATKVAQSLQTYVQGGLEAVITDVDFLTRILGMSAKEAQSIVEATAGRVEEEDTGGSPLLSLVGGMTGFIEFFKTAQAGGMSEEQLKQALMLFFKLSPEKAEAIIADGIQPPPDPNAGVDPFADPFAGGFTE